MNMMEEFRSQDEWRHIWWMIEKENTLNWWSHQNSWISIKLKSLAKVRLVIALSTNHAFDFFEHYLRNLTSVLVWAASPRGSYWVRKQTQSQREMGRWERRQRKGWELRLDCPGSAWAGVTWAQLSLTPGRSSDQAKRCHWEVFLLERRRIIHSSWLVCRLGEPFVSPLSDNLTRRQPANILICPGIFISHTLILILVLLTTFAVSFVQFRISYSFPPCFNWRDTKYTRFQSPISSLSLALSSPWLLHFLSILPFSSSCKIPFSDFSSLNIHSEIIEVRIGNFTRNLQFPYRNMPPENLINFLSSITMVMK